LYQLVCFYAIIALAYDVIFTAINIPGQTAQTLQVLILTTQLAIDFWLADSI
jgi:hypothetical protein